MFQRHPEAITVIISSPERWRTFCVFNGNSYPEVLDKNVNDCATRLVLFSNHVRMIRSEIERDIDRFMDSLSSHVHGYSPDKNPPIIIYYDGIGYAAAMHGAFIALKSFLDVYARLMGKLISPQQLKWKFERAKVGESELSGGRLVNWLIKSSPKSFAEARSLADVIVMHSESWITSAVKFRDDVCHYGDIHNMKNMHIELKRSEPYFDRESIVSPLMPNGEHVADYFSGLEMNLKNFIRETIRYLPNVDHQGLDLQRL